MQYYDTHGVLKEMRILQSDMFFKQTIRLSFWLCLCLWQSAQAQGLERRGYLGVDINYHEGLTVSRVYQGSTAQKIGIKEGDVIVKIGNDSVQNDTELNNSLRKFVPQRPISVSVVRNKQSLTLKGKLQELPKESYKDFALEYGQLKVQEQMLRTLTIRPLKKGKFPAVLIIQGAGCYSLDTPFDTTYGHTQIAHYLTRRDFITLRVDKSGVGDSKGTPCANSDFDTEVNLFSASLQHLRNLEGVDKENVFIVAHSIGGVIAPIVAKENLAKGIVVYGTIGTNWVEYLIDSRRKQLEMKEVEADAIEEAIRDLTECSVEYFIKQNSLDEVLEEKPECEQYLGKFRFKTDRYWAQLSRTNIARSWKQYEGHLLALWGEEDWASNRKEHELIVKIVNQVGSEKGTLLEVKNTDHGMRKKIDGEQKAPYNPLVSDLIYNWMDKLIKKEPVKSN